MQKNKEFDLSFKIDFKKFFKQEMIKEEILSECQEGRRYNGKRRNSATYDRLSLPHEIYESHLMIQTKIVTPSDTQGNDI